MDFRFTAELWEAEAEAAWVFMTVPEDVSDEIADLAPRRPGFGSVRVEVSIGSTEWSTSVFPDSKLGRYVLPVKKAVRVAQELAVGDTAEVDLSVIETSG